MKDYLMLILADLMLAGNFALNKVYQKREGTSLKAGFRFNALLGICTALVFWAAGGFTFHCTLFSLAAAALLTVLCTTYNLIGFRIMKSDTMAMYTLFLMTGGMTVPYIWGLLFLDEPFSVLRTIGLLLIIGGVIVSNTGSKRPGKAQLAMCIAVFFLNGFVSVTSKLHQIEVNLPTVSATEFVVLGGLFKFVAGSISYFVVRNRETGEDKPAQSGKSGLKGALVAILGIVIVSALLDGGSYFLQLIGAANLPATVLYPFVTGGSLVCTALAGVILFKEKLSKNVIMSLVLCFAGTLMFL